MAKLRALEDTQDGRLLRRLLLLVQQLGTEVNALRADGAGCPPCDCANPIVGEVGSITERRHEPGCASLLRFNEHVRAVRHEWGRAKALASALRELKDAVGAEVAVHPGIHDRVARAFKAAAQALLEHEESKFPGDDGLPF